jgi:hypothetical protein
MKKSRQITLGIIFSLALTACDDNNADTENPEWITGQENGSSRDTTINDQQYRYYGSGWYPVYGGYICPRYYSRPYTYEDISATNFRPSAPANAGAEHGVSTGGFGHSASGGEGGGE